MNREEDIVQIRKYLSGELNARAMYELERRALDDPFLMDALEGFQHVSAGQEANLSELTNRLRQRSEREARKIMPWMPLSVAASILIILGIGIWFFTSGNNRNEPKRVVAQNVVPDKKEMPKASVSDIKADTLKKEKEGATSQANKEVYVKANPTIGTSKRPAQKEYSPANPDLSTPQSDASPATAETSLSADKADKGDEYKYLSPKKDSLGANDILVGDLSKKRGSNQAMSKSKLPPSTQTVLKSRADGVTVSPDNGRTITGTVMGNDGTPITGATVKVLGRSFGAVTDADGKFILSDVSKGQTLSVNYIGYSGKKVKADQDSMHISLEPGNNSLSEVAVVRENENNKAKIQDAHPRDGWKAFDDYVARNAQLPDSKTGKVKVAFTVGANGALSQFKIVRSLSDDADKKAISLISTGPAWVGDADGKPKEVTVTLTFH